MHICYLADAGSPIAQNWISYFAASGRHRVTVISSYPCTTDAIPGAHVIQFPVAFSSLSHRSNNGTGTRDRVSRLVSQFRRGPLLEFSTGLRSRLAPLDIRRSAGGMASLIHQVQPDLLHAMRLPYEGFLASASSTTVPLLISTWGNDFSLFADRNRVLSNLTNAALSRADGLHCDCRRDVDVAFRRGFSPNKPWRVLPGNGGVQTNIFFDLHPSPEFLRELRIPENTLLVVNPRGFRAYVRNDTFFRAIPRVLKEIPNAFFVAVAMAGNPAAERWVRRLKIEKSIRLLPNIRREQLAALFASAQISVSPSTHDGTPNSLLEAMACGCLPVVGKVDSLREWIVDEENGLMCDVSDANSLAQCIIRALRDESLRQQAAEINRTVTRLRADYSKGMVEAENLYEEVVTSAGRKQSLASA